MADRKSEFKAHTNESGSLLTSRDPNTYTEARRSESKESLSSMENTSIMSTSSMIKENPRIMSDVVIGLSDGLQVPFALAAGLSSLGSSKIVVAGAMAELIAGSLSMGAGGWLAGQSEKYHFDSEQDILRRQLSEDPSSIIDEIISNLEEQGVSPEAAKAVVDSLRKTPQCFENFVLSQRGMQEPQVRTALFSGFTIGASYFFGGLIPLIPYLLIHNLKIALFYSIIVACTTLFCFGYVKSLLLIASRRAAFFSAIETLLIGGAAAAVSYLVVYLLQGRNE